MMIHFQPEASQRDRCGRVFVSRVFPLIKALDRRLTAAAYQFLLLSRPCQDGPASETLLTAHRT